MNGYAPVLVTVYNRYGHFVQCMQSLASCRGAEKTDVFIASDAASREEDIERVLQIREYAKGLKAFQSLTILAPDENIGAIQNYRRAEQYVFERYDTLIFTEDDNIFAPDFLEFVNQGLSVYENRKDIYAVCGYNYPIEMPVEYKHDTYIWIGFSAWGVGIWKDRWESTIEEPPLEELKSFLKDRSYMKKLDAIAGHYRPALQNIIDTGHYTGDTIYSYQMFMHGHHCVFPSVTRVRNIGHDGSGVHCVVDDSQEFLQQEISCGDKPIVFNEAIEPDDEVYRVLSKYFQRSRLYSLKLFLKRMINTKKSK